MKKLFTLSFLSLISVITNSQNPSFEWVRGIEIGNSHFSFSSMEDVTVDGQGNVISTGNFRGNYVDFDGENTSVQSTNLSTGSVQSCFVQKMDANGNFLWVYKIGNGTTVQAFTIDSDAAGNLYCSGYFFGTNDFDPGAGVANLTSFGGADTYILKINSDGTFGWVKQIGGAEAVLITSIVLDASENITLTGGFSGTIDFDPTAGVSNLTALTYSDMFIAKLDPTGNLMWAKQVGSTAPNTGYEGYTQHTVDDNGNILVTGYFNSTLDFDPGPNNFDMTSIGGYDLFVLKLDPAGDFVWAKQVGGDIGSASAIGDGIDTDASNNIYVVGTFASSVDFDPNQGVDELYGHSGDAFVLKLTDNGDYLWARQIDGDYKIWGYDIVVSPDGTSYSTGGFIGTPDFDHSANTFTLNAGSTLSQDAYILKLDANGNFVWAGDMGTVQEDFGTAIDMDENGNIFTVGKYSDAGNSYPELDFDPGPGEATILSNVTTPQGLFILKLSQSNSPVGVDNSREERTFTVFPNPSSGNIRVMTDAASAITLNIFDMTGKLVYSEAVSSTFSDITLPQQQGIYLLQVLMEDGSIVSQRVVKN